MYQEVQLSGGRPALNYRRIATITGWLWVITFVTSIPARFVFYAPVLKDGQEYVGQRRMTR